VRAWRAFGLRVNAAAVPACQQAEHCSLLRLFVRHHGVVVRGYPILFTLLAQALNAGGWFFPPATSQCDAYGAVLQIPLPEGLAEGLLLAYRSTNTSFLD